jgi:hypothetical protein
MACSKHGNPAEVDVLDAAMSQIYGCLCHELAAYVLANSHVAWRGSQNQERNGRGANRWRDDMRQRRQQRRLQEGVGLTRRPMWVGHLPPVTATTVAVAKAASRKEPVHNG